LTEIKANFPGNIGAELRKGRSRVGAPEEIQLKAEMRAAGQNWEGGEVIAGHYYCGVEAISLEILCNKDKLWQ
jgi:hypothetical protein